MFNFFKPFWIPIAKYAGIILGVIMVYIKGRQDNKVAQQRKEAVETLKGVIVRDKTENAVTAADIVERSRLRERWTKP